MDQKFLVTLASGVCAILIFIRYFVSKKQTREGKRLNFPQPDGALPIVGHLHRFGGGKLTHKVLGAMADKHGPALAVKLGSHEVVIISSSELARECFTTHDKVFPDRPRVTASKILGYDFAMFGFAPYGKYWREMRKIITLEVLSHRRIEMLKPIRTSELETMSRKLHALWVSSGGSSERGVFVDMKPWFVSLARDLIVRIVGGKRNTTEGANYNREGAEKCEEVIREFVALFDVFVIADAVPSLGWMDFQGQKKSMRRVAQELDKLVDGWLKEHKQRRSSGESKEERDFMDVLLEILKDDKQISTFDKDTIIKTTCLNILLAGGDAVAITLTWALSLLLNNPEKLVKVQQELDTEIGRNKNVEECDIKKLVYLQAVIKETLRLYPPSPVLGMRSALEDCTLSTGHHIPAGTRLLVNAWKIQRDEKLWPEPNKFKPERFLTTHSHIDTRGLDFELIPFGAGRRSCPGISLGTHTVQICLATVLHCFDFAIPTGVEKIDMTESAGLTNLKATPLEVILKPRLPTILYGH